VQGDRRLSVPLTCPLAIPRRILSRRLETNCSNKRV